MVGPWCGGVGCIMCEVVDNLVWSRYIENFIENRIINMDIYINPNFIVHVSCMCEIALNIGML
jgi:hypothetical protein